jgi:hypothetical protein
MEQSGSGGKKIVFKKRILAAQALPEQEAAQHQEVSQDEAPEQVDYSHYYYQGEIFDQYYRPLAIEGGEAKLAELAAEPITAPAPQPQLDRFAREARSREQQETAEALAHQMYNLAQKVRETDIDVYLSAFNVVLAEKTAREMKDILDKANDFFTEHYYTPIRERGERPEIYHQILKRVGHDASDRISRIVKGLDVEGTAKAIWDLYHGEHADKAARIAAILLDCTELQVRALREEFLLLPYKDVARQLFSIIHPSAQDSGGGGRRTIGKTEVYETKRLNAVKTRDQLQAIKYLLLGRSTEELTLIRRFYVDCSDGDSNEAEAGLDAHLRKHFSAIELDKLGSLFSGWSAHTEAEEIHKILYPATLSEELEDTLSDPRDSVDRDFTQGIGPFLRRFKKRRMWRGKASVRHRVLVSYEVIGERLQALSLERFLKTNDALYELYGYEIDPTLFPSLGLFDPRRRATILHDAIASAFDLSQMLRAFEFLAPRSCLAVQQAYRCLYSEEAKAAIEARLSVLKLKLTPRELQESFHRFVDGHGRWPLNLDLLARFRGGEPPSGVWDPEFKPSEADEQAAIEVAQLLDREADIGELDRPIRELLWNCSYDELNRIERAFFELTDPKVPLRLALDECLSLEALGTIELLLAGVDASDVAQRAYEDPSALLVLRELPPSHISMVREIFERLHFVDVSEHLLQRYSGLQDEDGLIETLSIVLVPEAHAFHKTLRSMRRDTAADMESLRQHWSGLPLLKLLSLERAFDLEFPRLRQHLKYSAARQALTPQLFTDAILHFEGVDPEIVARLLESFDSVNIDMLQDILRSNRDDQRTIEEVFDLLYPDAQLRRCIKEMKVDLDLINETLLHLEGHSAREVAGEIYDLVSTMSSEELGAAVLDVLAPPSATRRNKRIPEDINWSDEMMFQVGLAFQRDFGSDMVEMCRKVGVPMQMLEELTTRLFGHEVCSSARDIYNIMKLNKEGQTSPDYSEERMCSYLESRGVRHRERLLRAYNSHWAHMPGFGHLVDDIAKFFRDTHIKKKMLAMLIGLGSERRRPGARPIDLH